MPTELNESFRIDPTALPAEAVIFGVTPWMREIQGRIDHLRSNDLPVLIEGESGTGKEVVARFIHTRSDRRNAPFVKLNCAAIPPELLERELFGVEAGADGKARPGLVEIASGGTLFLDEIEEMNGGLQEKLLRLLESNRYTRVGSNEERNGSIRVICVTNCDLPEAVVRGAFREDLFDCIHQNLLKLPALRDRKSDIPQLCEYFLGRLSLQFNKAAPKLNQATMHLLKRWDWPGNLRELENWTARAIVLGDNRVPGAELRGRATAAGLAGGRRRRFSSLRERSRVVNPVARGLILEALQANHWNRRKTAEQLHMSYRSLLHSLRQAGVHPRWRMHRPFPPLH